MATSPQRPAASTASYTDPQAARNGGSAAGGGSWWLRWLPVVRSRERGRFTFFALLALLLGAGQTLGVVGTEALFLARVGPAALPLTFVLAAIAAVIGTLLYSLVVGRVRNDGLLVWMLGVAVAVLCMGAASADVPGIPTALLCFYFVAQAVLVNHYWTFAGDYFDTPTMGRLFPLFSTAGSLGAVAGGAAALLLVRGAPLGVLVGGWALTFALSALWVFGARRRLRRWGPIDLVEADETSVEGLVGALRYIRRTPLGQWLVLSTLGMVLALFTSQYLYLSLFEQAFPEEADLAGFLAAYLTVTNGLEVAVALVVTPALIRRFGVARTNLVHPLLTLVSFGALAVAPGLGSAVAARANRELLQNAVNEPIRHLVYNALPFRFRGRIRAFLDGITQYASMALAGALLLAVPSGVDPLWLCAVGAATALLYVLANLGVRREYLRALVTGLREGRLDLSELGQDMGAWEVSRLAELWKDLLADVELHPSQLDLGLAPVLARRGLVEPLLEAATHKDARVRAAALRALREAPGQRVKEVLLIALGDPDAEVRRSAVSTIADVARQGGTELPEELAVAVSARLLDEDVEVRAEAALCLGGPGRAVFEDMVRSSDPAAVRAALRRVPEELVWAALERAGDVNPVTRAEALECLARLAPPLAVEPAQLLRDLSHDDLRVRRAALRALAIVDDDQTRSALARAFDDPAREVREVALESLGRGGEVGVLAALPALDSSQLTTVRAALGALGLSETATARRILRAELRRRVRDAWDATLALHRLEASDDPALRFARAAWADLADRSRRLAFDVLALVEDPKVMRTVERVLRIASARARGDALEVLSNLGDRETARLLVLMLEDGPMDEKLAEVAAYLDPPRDQAEALARARACPDRWVRRGVEACDRVRSGETHEGELMDRLIMLRRVPLFARLTLDQLEAINHKLVEERYVAGEIVFREGHTGDRLYVLADGEVDIYRNYQGPGQIRLGGQVPVSCFGEMAALDDEPRSATIVARTDTRLLSLEGGQLRELVLQMPEMSFDFFRVLAARVRNADARLEQVMAEGTGD